MKQLDALCIRVIECWLRDVQDLKSLKIESLDYLAENNYHFPQHYDLRAVVTKYQAGSISDTDVVTFLKRCKDNFKHYILERNDYSASALSLVRE